MMKNLASAVLVIFTVLLSTQFVSHSYTLIFSGQESVLDRYNKKKAEITIDNSLSLKELSMIYADAEKRIKLLDSGKPKKGLSQYESSEDPYLRKSKIQELITGRESDYGKLKEIIFFWIAGAVFIACGSLVYVKFEKWIGAPFVVSGFTLMAWKTGPPFFITAVTPDSMMILTVKIICTFITLAGLIAFWYFFRRFFEK